MQAHSTILAGRYPGDVFRLTNLSFASKMLVARYREILNRI